MQSSQILKIRYDTYPIYLPEIRYLVSFCRRIRNKGNEAHHAPHYTYINITLSSYGL